MKLYNKKKLFTGLSELVLATIAIIVIRVKDMDVKFMIVLLILFVLGFVHIRSAFSKEDTFNDKVEELDERTKLVSLTINNMMMKITAFITITLIITAIILYGITSNVNILIAILPILIMLPTLIVIYIVLCFYYERKM